MSWTDQKAIEVIKYLRDKYEIKTLVETGTYMGVNAELHHRNFEKVITCEKIKEYFDKAQWRLCKYNNVFVVNENSPDFLKKLTLDRYLFYLDAHFYNPRMPKGKGKFIILKELENMKKFKNSVIVIHDFDNGLGHCNYDGVRLDIKLLREPLKNITDEFYLYTNRLESCDIVKPNREDMEAAGLPIDEETLGNLNYAWKTPRLTYRGILYCLPTELKQEELDKLGLRKWN